MNGDNKEYSLLLACQRKPTPYTPIWLMRQAGRYLKEYRALRKKYSFLEMCKNPELAAEVTLLPIRKFEMDAAILFSDILLPLEPMGVDLEFKKGEGPVIRPVRDEKEIAHLRLYVPEKTLSFLFKTIKIVRKELDGKVPLIGFSGAPFTLASYLIEGGHSSHYIHTKSLMYQNRLTWMTLMEKLSKMLIRYLDAQIKAGVQVIQLFDSWVGCLSPTDYKEFVLPYTKKIVEGIKQKVPLIHFATSNATLLQWMKQAGGDVIGVDWRIEIGEAWERVGYEVGIQGNLDPVVLLGSVDLIRKEVKRILDSIKGRPGHIFNLGHGVLPNTPVENVAALVDMVHEYSSKKSLKEI
ncbi:MAG: uroporphyrinogen decarboxylase [Thermodesulfobacteriota bacterium]